MWSYEIVFEHSERPAGTRKKRSRNGAHILGTMKTVSNTVVADSGDLALQYALDELKKMRCYYADYELVAVIRRNAIVGILREPV
jgi:hypothetical protein